MKAVFFVVLFGVALLLLGCEGKPEGGGWGKDLYFLVNRTDGLLHYKACLKTSMSDLGTVSGFEAILNPNDTLFLYQRELMGGRYFFFEDPTHFSSSSSDLILQNKDKYILFADAPSDHLFCGEKNFVQIEIGDRNVHYYWTIDSAYVANKACGIDFQSNEAIIGIETCLEIEFQEEVSDEN